mmetsp:Transcript_14329/g.22595  ORF Transcript_14329/g.22595 Transcript_14329/m.22595 type:complete len:431 (+) Transcript_14329:399-1691(+)
MVVSSLLLTDHHRTIITIIFFALFSVSNDSRLPNLRVGAGLVGAQILQWHVLGQDPSHLVAHLGLRPPPVEQPGRRHHRHDGQDDGDHAADGHPLGAAAGGLLAVGRHAGHHLLAAHPAGAGADGGLRAGRVARANCGEHRGGDHGAPLHHAIHVDRGHDHDAVPVLLGDLCREELVRHVALEPARVGHALVHLGAVHARLLHHVGLAGHASELLRGVAGRLKAVHVPPPLGADANVRLVGRIPAVGPPDAQLAQILLHHVRAADALVAVVVRVGQAVAALVRAQVAALVGGGRAAQLVAVVDHVVRREVGARAQLGGDHLEVLLEGLGAVVDGGGPQVPLHAVVRVGQRPAHLRHHQLPLQDLPLHQVRVHLLHQEGRDGDVRAAAVVGHDRLQRLAGLLGGAGRVPAEALVVRDQHARRAGVLRAPDL